MLNYSNPVKVVVVGTKGSAANLILQINDAINHHGINWIIQGVCIDNLTPGENIMGLNVLSGTKDIQKLVDQEDFKFLFALFKPEKMSERFKLLQNLNIPADRFVNFIHPQAYVSPDVKMGYGNIILSHSVIQSGVRIGNFNFINSNTVIEHDTTLDECNFIAAGAILGSETKINKCNFIGLNATIKEEVIIDKNVFVGMGSVVLDSFSDAKVYGVPAIKISGWT